MTDSFPWWYPVGAQVREGGTAFRVWADMHKTVSVLTKGGEHSLAAEGGGYFSETLRELEMGTPIPSKWTGRGRFPILLHDFSRKVRMARRKLSMRIDFRGQINAGKEFALPVK